MLDCVAPSEPQPLPALRLRPWLQPGLLRAGLMRAALLTAARGFRMPRALPQARVRVPLLRTRKLSIPRDAVVGGAQLLLQRPAQRLGASTANLQLELLGAYIDQPTLNLGQLVLQQVVGLTELLQLLQRVRELLLHRCLLGQLFLVPLLLLPLGLPPALDGGRAGHFHRTLQELRLLRHEVKPAHTVLEVHRHSGFAPLRRRHHHLLAGRPAVDLQAHAGMPAPLQGLHPQELHRLGWPVGAQGVVPHLGRVCVACQLHHSPICVVDGGPLGAICAHKHHELGDPLVPASEQAAKPGSELLLKGQITKQLQEAVALCGVLASEDLARCNAERRHVLAQRPSCLQGGCGLGK
mmetsp:Transcript_63684/g.205190  ORF Transcript_63684/g.205190 Transcript_63684/m.205190 type:complete len:352 (+) Transcript_63684:397-1452(+)